MYIIDYIPEGELDGNGHYRLQDEWLKELLKNREYTGLKVTLANFIVTLYKLLRYKIPIFMPNCSLYDRFSILDTILLLVTPFQKKVVIVHTVSKLNILNVLFCRVVKNCRVYVYSNTLKRYLVTCGLSATNEVILAQYPNADMIHDISLSKDFLACPTSFDHNSLAIAWGNAAGKIDERKLENFLALSVVERVVLVGKITPSLAMTIKQCSTVVEIWQSATDMELAGLLNAATINLMLFPDQYDFYKSKIAASGVYLTALKFGIPSVISGNFGALSCEILADGSSIHVKSNTDLKSLTKQNMIKMRVKDPFHRDNINLGFIDAL